MSIDSLAHVTKEMDWLHRTVGEEVASTGVKLSVHQSTHIGVILVALCVAITDQVG